MNVVPLSCPSCGAQGNIRLGDNGYTCLYCSSQFSIVMNQGEVSLGPLEKYVSKISGNIDKTASELAINRLQGEIASLNEKKKLLEIEITNTNSKIKKIGNPKSYLTMAKMTIVAAGFIWLIYLMVGSPAGFTSTIWMIILMSFFMVFVWFNKLGQLKAPLESIANSKQLLSQTNDQLNEKNGKLEKHRQIVSF
jgi:hypothetical protein